MRPLASQPGLAREGRGLFLPLTVTLGMMEYEHMAGPIYTSDAGIEVTEEMKISCGNDIERLTATGVEITRIQIPRDGRQKRYFIEFPEDKPMYKSRIELEAAGYEVGQAMGANKLHFFCTRKPQMGEGW